MRFEAVAFDLDGTLYPNLGLYLTALPRLLPLARRFGAFNHARQLLRAQGMEKERRPDFPHDAESFHEAEAALVAQRLGESREKARKEIERIFYRDVEELFSRVRPYRGLEPALNKLKAAGLRLGLLSDLPPRRKLELMRLSSYFEVQLCSETTGALKPAADPFIMLAEAMNVQPQRMLYVGNSGRIDAAGSKAAGMTAALIHRRPDDRADFCFHDWQDLVDFALHGGL